MNHKQICALKSAIALIVFTSCILCFYPALVSRADGIPEETTLEVIKFETKHAIDTLVVYIIQWAFWLAGILAFVMIVYAGFQYLTSGGNTAQQKDAQERIISAIIGIILLFAFWIILNTINPDILKTGISAPVVGPPPAPPYEEIKPQQIGDFVLIGPNAQLDNYASIPLSYEFSDGAYINKATADKLVNLAKTAPSGWQVTEACITISNGICITTVSHQSTCHSLGTCVDIGYGSAPKQEIQDTFINAANQAGFDVLNEYACPQYGSGFHVEPAGGYCLQSECWFCASA